MTTARETAATVATVAAAAAPFLPPNAALALTIGSRLMNLVLEASALGQDVSDERMQAIVSDYNAARARNDAAVVAAGGTPPAG